MDKKQKLAADFGFGWNKFICGDKCLITPTAVERYRINNFDNQPYYEFNDKAYLVGEAAKHNAGSSRDYDYLEQYAPLFFFDAIKYFGLDPKEEIILSTGLSLADWDNRQKFAERLTDFMVNKTHVNNVKVVFTPQGKGAYLAALKQYPELATKLVQVVDLGTYTLDNLYFYNGKALGNECWAEREGTYKIIQQVQKYILEKYRLSSNESAINEILQTRSINVLGNKIDLGSVVDEETDIYCEMVLNKIRNKNADLYRRTEAILFVGGGTTLADKFLPKDKQIIYLDNPQMANVNGYWGVVNNGKDSNNH